MEAKDNELLAALRKNAQLTEELGQLRHQLQAQQQQQQQQHGPVGPLPVGGEQAAAAAGNAWDVWGAAGGSSAVPGASDAVAGDGGGSPAKRRGSSQLLHTVSCSSQQLLGSCTVSEPGGTVGAAAQRAFACTRVRMLQRTAASVSHACQISCRPCCCCPTQTSWKACCQHPRQRPRPARTPAALPLRSAARRLRTAPPLPAAWLAAQHLARCPRPSKRWLQLPACHPLTCTRSLGLPPSRQRVRKSWRPRAHRCSKQAHRGRCCACMCMHAHVGARSPMPHTQCMHTPAFNACHCMH